MPSQAGRAARAYQENRDMDESAVKIARRVSVPDDVRLPEAEGEVDLLRYADDSVAYRSLNWRAAYVVPGRYREWAKYELAKRRPEGDRK